MACQLCGKHQYTFRNTKSITYNRYTYREEIGLNCILGWEFELSMFMQAGYIGSCEFSNSFCSLRVLKVFVYFFCLKSIFRSPLWVYYFVVVVKLCFFKRVIWNVHVADFVFEFWTWWCVQGHNILLYTRGLFMINTFPTGLGVSDLFFIFMVVFLIMALRYFLSCISAYISCR